MIKYSEHYKENVEIFEKEIETFMKFKSSHNHIGCDDNLLMFYRRMFICFLFDKEKENHLEKTFDTMLEDMHLFRAQVMSFAEEYEITETHVDILELYRQCFCTPYGDLFTYVLITILYRLKREGLILLPKE